MKNWKEVFGVQSADRKKDANTALLAYLHLTQATSGQPAFKISNFQIPIDEIVLTEDEVAKEIDKAFDTFTETVENDTIAILRGKNDVAKRSRRGSAVTNYNNYWFYCGTHITDRPVLVIGHEGKYAIRLHPDFDNYGFIVQ